ncbi:putative hexosyltransferase [Jatrophihabitans fulvus]
MNDLAEKALRGLDAVRRAVVARPVPVLAASGFLVSTAVTVTGGWAAAVRPNRSLTTWLGLEQAHGETVRATRPAVLLLVAIGALAALWLVTLAVVRRVRPAESRTWLLVAAWTAPLAIGPPLLDTSVYRYVAFGFVQRAGRDPASSPPSSLGPVRIVDAIDPADRDVVSASGPLGSLLHHVTVSVAGGSPLVAVLALRVVGLVVAVAIGRLALELARTRRPDGAPDGALVLLLSVGNPLVLLYVVAAPHQDGLLAALALGALVAMRRRAWTLAAGLAAAAGSLVGQGFVLVPVVVVAHLLVPLRRPAWQVIVRDGGTALLVTLALAVAGPGARWAGFSWVGAVPAQFQTDTPYSATGIAGELLQWMVPGSAFDDVLAATRVTAATAAAATVVYLLVSARYRSREYTAGFALLAPALLAPVLAPAFLLWGLLCLAPVSGPRVRVAVVSASVAACGLQPAGFSSRTATVVSGCWLAVVAVATWVVLRRVPDYTGEREEEPDAAQRPPETSRTAGRTSAR